MIFKINDVTIQLLLDAVVKYGVEVFPQPKGEIFGGMEEVIEKYKAITLSFIMSRKNT